MSRLWEEEVRLASPRLRQQTLISLGGAETIIRSHLDIAMAGMSRADRYAAARVFHYLVTPSGTKIAHRARDLASYSKLPVDDLVPVLQRLAERDVRVLR